MTTDLKVSQATESTTIADGDSLYGVIGGGSRRITYLNFKKQLYTAASGTAGTDVVASEFSNGRDFVTVLALNDVSLTPTIPANAEGAGAIIYTFPSGVYIGHACRMDINSGVVDSATNAADMGVGSVIASGDVSVLSGTAGFEDWVTGQTVADVSSIATDKATLMTAGGSTVFEAADSHVLHINIAGTWNSAITTLSLTGTITVHWTFMGS